MKKFFYVFVFLMIFVAGCSQNNKQNNIDTLSQSVDSDSNCEEAIKTFLDKGSKYKPKNKVLAQDGDKVGVFYIGRFDDKNIFDTNIEVIAKACGQYNQYREYGESLEFDVGGNLVIGGFSDGVRGMSVGQISTTNISANNAYGQRTKDKIVSLPKDRFGKDADNIVAGMTVSDGFGTNFKVYEVTEYDILIDNNHSLAGKDLIFDIFLHEIK